MQKKVVRRVRRHARLWASLGLCCLLSSACLRVPLLPSEPVPALVQLLSPLAISMEELGIRELESAVDVWRLRVVEHLLAHPLEAISLSRGMATDFRAHRRSLGETLTLAASLIDVTIPSDPPTTGARGPTLATLLWELRANTFLAPRSLDQIEAHLAAVPSEIHGIIADLLNAMTQAAPRIRGAFAGLSHADRSFLLAGLLETDSSTAPFDETETWRFVELAQRVDRVSLFAGAALVAAAVDRSIVALRGWRDRVTTARRAEPAWREAAHGDVLFVADTVLGLVIIGGPGPSTYKRDAALIIDLGGDDTYLNQAGGTNDPNRPLSIVIDVDGDDRYIATEDVAQGAGVFGVGILADLGGRDTYIAQNFAQGVGVFGVGLLMEAGGDDRYEGQAYVQGAGAFGVGVLTDESGDDRFQATLNAQGFGMTGALGLLLNELGDDVYVIAERPSDIRQPTHALTFGQGFATGIRPLASGGIGLLVDGQGSDHYRADYFAQGASYWYALGALVDEAGDDEYVATRYAQGAGIHFSIGVLWDGRGNDQYRSWGVSQGAGHDFAVGVLADADGDDLYQAAWLSQGAGSADGIGMLIDLQGNDHYQADGKDVQGYGRSARRSQSLGLLIDLGGTDSYSGQGRNNTRWDGEEYGGGLDSDDPRLTLGFSLAPRTVAAPELTTTSPLTTPGYRPPRDPTFPTGSEREEKVRRLLAQAADPSETSAGTKLREAARSELRALGEAAVPALVNLLGSINASLVSETLNVLVGLGELAHAAVLERLDDPYWSVRRRASYVLAQRPTQEVARVLRDRALRDPDPWVRAYAVEGIGRACLPDAPELLARLRANDPSLGVRRGAVRGLWHLNHPGVESALVQALNDRAFPVRLAARTALRELHSGQKGCARAPGR